MSSAQRVNAERPDQRRDGYVPIVVSDVDKTNQFADTATLRRLRHERDRSADDFVQAADLVPAPPGLSEADARIVQQSYPLFVRSVIASWFGAAAHSAFIVLRTRSAEPGVRRARLLRAAKGWAVAPLGVAAVLASTVVPASMFLQGTAMGSKLYTMRMRCFSAFGVLDPWAKALHRVERKQDTFEHEVLPALLERPRDPNAVVKGAGRDEVAHEWALGVAERSHIPAIAAFSDTYEREAAERKAAFENADVVRKNKMIQRNIRSTTKEDRQPKREREFSDDE